MGYAILWKHAPEGEESKLLVGHPGTFTETENEAKDEGQKVLECPEAEGFQPVTILDVHFLRYDEVQACDEVEIGDELLFYDVTEIHWITSKLPE